MSTSRHCKICKTNNTQNIKASVATERKSEWAEKINSGLPMPKDRIIFKLKRIYKERKDVQKRLEKSLREWEKHSQKMSEMRSRLDFIDGTLAEIDDLLSETTQPSTTMPNS